MIVIIASLEMICTENGKKRGKAGREVKSEKLNVRSKKPSDRQWAMGRM